MRNIKEIMRDARMRLGPFEMTALEIIRVVRASILTVTLQQIEDALVCSMAGEATICGRPVKVVG